MSSRLSEILDAIDSGVVVQDAEQRLLYVNRAAAELSGWASPEEMILAAPGERLDRFELLDEDGKPLLQSTLPARRVLAGQTPEPLVVGFRVKATGEERWSLVRATAVRDGLDGARLAVSTFHDLTARVRAERESHASGRRYREIVEALPVVAWFADPDGTIIVTNARWLEYTGMMAVSGTIQEVDQLHPEDRAGLVARWDDAQAAIAPLEATVRLRRHDGTYRWHLLRVVPSRGDSGAVHGWIGTATDIDDERRASNALVDSERQFRDLTDSAPLLVWLCNPDRRRTFVNRGWLEFTGRSLDEEIGHGWIEAVHPEDRERVEAAYEAALGEQQRFEIEYRLRHHDGVHRWILDIGVPRLDSEGELLGFVGSAVEIEARKRAGDLARLIADAALRLDEARDLDETIRAAAELAVPGLADWCLIDLVDADGAMRRVGALAADPSRQTLVERIKAYPTDPHSDRPGAEAIREGRPVLVEDLRDSETLRSRTGDLEPLARIVAAMEARSLIVQPLTARGETIGAIFFVVGPNRSYQQADLEMTTELSRRVALAIANARIHAAEQEARRAAEAAAERVERLQRITRGLSGASSRDAVVDLVVREGRAGLGASAAVVVIKDDTGLAIVASDGYAATRVEAYRSIPVDSAVPLARAVRESRPVWVSDARAAEAEAEDEDSRAAIENSPNRSICAVPLIADGSTFGAIGLSFADSHEFDMDEQALIGAYADLCAQALARVALTSIRERLLGDLESERARLETLLQQLPEGLIIAEAPSGRIVLANDRVEEILGVPRAKLHHIAGGDAYRGFDADGHELLPDEWPLARAVRGETVAYEELELVRADGTRSWVAKRAGPVFDRGGNVIAGVATIIDISEAHQARENRRFLSTATEVLGSSLDYEETIQQVAKLAVPRIADWCAIDILDEASVPRRLAVAHPDPAKVALARELEERYPSPPDAPRGLRFVLRTGKSDMMSEIPADVIETAARDPDHLRLLKALDLQSYICVPIIAGGQVLGAMTFVTTESGRHYGHDDLVFAESVAARAASAISNARSFREAVRYKRVLDATLDVVVMFDPVSLRISYANQGAADQLGYAGDELIGLEATDLVSDLDTIGLRGLVAPLVSGDADSRTETLVFHHRDGHDIPVEVLLQHVAPPGETGRIVAVARDIAERIEAQGNLRRLAESEHARAAELNAVIRAMGDGIFVCGDDGAIRLSNPAADALLPDLAERTYDAILSQLDHPTHEPPALATIGGPIDVRGTGSDERWLELSTYPVVHELDDTKGGPETIVMLRDVTAARQRQAIRDTFIGVLSHELRTPVTTIFAGSKVLAKDDDQLSEATRREIFADIVVEAERLHRLVEDVIAMTRFGEDEGDVGSEPVLIQRILPGLVRSEQNRWPGVNFELDLPTGLPTAAADPTYVDQVVRNLLSNAAKYGGSGTTVNVHVEADADEITVRVVDDGPGFPDEDADRVFELFFRSPRTASAAAGAGIGLFVCARLIRAMGGRVWAKPLPERGAEFAFTLRVMDED